MKTSLDQMRALLRQGLMRKSETGPAPTGPSGMPEGMPPAGEAPMPQGAAPPMPGAMPPVPGAMPPMPGAMPPMPGAMPPMPGAMPPMPPGGAPMPSEEELNMLAGLMGPAGMPAPGAQPAGPGGEPFPPLEGEGAPGEGVPDEGGPGETGEQDRIEQLQQAVEKLTGQITDEREELNERLTRLEESISAITEYDIQGDMDEADDLEPPPVEDGGEEGPDDGGNILAGLTGRASSAEEDVEDGGRSGGILRTFFGRRG